MRRRHPAHHRRRRPPPPPTTAPPTTAAADHAAADHPAAHDRPAQRRQEGRRLLRASGASTAATTTSRTSHTSGSAAKLTHILYAFGNTTGGRCAIGDSYADYDKAYTAADSVDGVADTWDQPLRGSFNQLRKLKKMYPHLKVIWSFGGWTWSGGFTQAAQNPAAFADSCYNLVEDPRWADVFDGIDVDWEYPNACGLTCDTSGPNAFKNVIGALRSKFGSSALVTAAITADGSNGGKIDATDYAGAVRQPQLAHADDLRLLRRVQRAGPHRPALAAHLVRRHPAAGLLLRRGDPEAQDQGRPGQQAAARHRLLRPGLDRGHPGRPGRHAPPAPPPAPTRRASRTTRSSRTPARPPAPSPARRTPSAAATGGATTPRPPSTAR